MSFSDMRVHPIRISLALIRATLGKSVMPNDVKTIVSAIALGVAAILAYWSGSPVRPDLATFLMVTALFMVAAMWVFPEAGVKKGDLKKSIRSASSPAGAGWVARMSARRDMRVHYGGQPRISLALIRATCGRTDFTKGETNDRRDL